MQPQNLQNQSIQTQPQFLPHLKSILHFSHTIPLPPTANIFPYSPKHQTESKKKKKIKHKFETFTYYQGSQTILKLLFVTDNLFIDQGNYPFTDPSGKERPFSQVSGKRLIITEAAYIGHAENNLIVKKMEGVKLGSDGLQVETIDDNFELIPIGNLERFNQFLKVMTLNKNSIQLSIRVIINETQPQKPEVIDYEFFFREKKLVEKHGPKPN